MSEVIVKFFRDDGVNFVLNDSNWKIPSNGLEGFGDFSNSVTIVDNGVGDGGIISSRRVPQKDRTISAICRNLHMAEVLRAEATSFFRPKNTYKVYFTYMGRTRWAEGIVERFNISTHNIHEYMTLTVTLLFADPYLKSYEDFGQDIASIIGTAGFPYMCTRGQGSPTGMYRFADVVNITNDGDVEAYCKVVFRAKGAVLNPKLIINGHYVRVLDQMQGEDVIIMDFVASPPTVKKNGVNFIGRCDRTSEFDKMLLTIGNSTLQYDADNGTNLLSVSVYFNKLYASM
jgi:hypothetical protein